MSEFLTGAKSYGQAWKLSWHERLWPFLFLPGLIGLCYFPIVAFLGYRYGAKVVGYARDNWLPEFLRHKGYVFLMTTILAVVGLYVGFILFRNVIMILYSPILGVLSGKTEARATAGIPPVIQRGDILKGMIRGISMSLTSLMLSLGCLLICFCLLVIPVVGQIAMIVILPISQMFLAGVGFMDPTLERRGIGVLESLRFGWRYRARALGCGAVFMLLASIPALGWFLAPSLGIVAGTLLYLEIKAAETRRPYLAD